MLGPGREGPSAAKYSDIFIDEDALYPGPWERADVHGKLEHRWDNPRRAPILKSIGGKGLKGLLMAGAATAASPLAALADVLISPGQLGSGDLPEEDFLTDEQKTRYYQELMKPGRDMGLTPNFLLRVEERKNNVGC